MLIYIFGKYAYGQQLVLVQWIWM